VIPTGIEGELAVGEDVSPALRRIEVGEANRRDALQTDQPGCFDPAMSGDDLVIIADQHGIGEAELPMLSAIWRICFLEWVRAFLAQGRRHVTATGSMAMGCIFSQRPNRRGSMGPVLLRTYYSPSTRGCLISAFPITTVHL
jgi:hypothetical protein